ncbi:hypothetical protein OG884_02625 [Streptosporangium sp. NBC_01755]|uniref:hypothetical protein n=1 Tax=Streptosporangium sp. NBC_01755 TaxID=2975949 RepID=UPI002DD9ED82|nr:hypothetical protein [Streptosporangium sp. NBC_01755]WSD04305.1 hypothetical protein OG884_02625 [Streptosporangium sp. NBC_01755]
MSERPRRLASARATPSASSPADPRPRRRMPQPALLYSLIAVAFLLFTGFALFAHVLPHH